MSNPEFRHPLKSEAISTFKRGMTDRKDERCRTAEPGAVKALLRASVALALAQRATSLYAGDAPPHPYLAAVINSQELAARELDTVLERALTDAACAAPPSDAEEEISALLM